MKAMFTGGKRAAQRKVFAERRLAWAAFTVTFALIILTGLLEAWKNFAGWDLPDPMLFWLAQGHNLGMALTIILFIGHIQAAFIYKPNRQLLSGMFSGKINAEYARHRHSLWKQE